MTTIRGGRLLTENGLETGEVHHDGGRITSSSGGELVDADGLIVSPGLVDIQINGGFGHDFTQDPTTIWQVGERLPELGVTSFLPTVVTSPGEVTDLAIDVVSNRRPHGYTGADVLGLHFEGPWISPDMHGAHNIDHIVDPDTATARTWAGSDVVKMVTLAPERPGAGEVIGILATEGVVVSIGHTAATYDEARRSLVAGATLATHLFNQMTPLMHREPGVVGAALLDAGHCLLIVDGLHIAPGALEIAWRLLGRNRLVLVTDAMAAVGMGHGTYQLGDGPVTVADEGPRTQDGRLAGSVLTLPRAVSNLAATTTADMATALRCAAHNPATALGLTDRGTLDPGNRADLVLLDDDMNVVSTFVAGQRLHG